MTEGGFGEKNHKSTQGPERWEPYLFCKVCSAVWLFLRSLRSQYRFQVRKRHRLAHSVEKWERGSLLAAVSWIREWGVGLEGESIFELFRMNSGRNCEIGSMVSIFWGVKTNLVFCLWGGHPRKSRVRAWAEPDFEDTEFKRPCICLRGSLDLQVWISGKHSRLESFKKWALSV